MMPIQSNMLFYLLIHTFSFSLLFLPCQKTEKKKLQMGLSVLCKEILLQQVIGKYSFFKINQSHLLTTLL
jgi:hypothetical protein